MTKKFSAANLKSARLSQADFGSCIGLSKQRVNQLLKAGLLVGDDDGVAVLESLRNFYVFRSLKNFVDVQPQDEYFSRFLSKV